ncbi:MAG TPA: adenine deaminase [Geobacteraceae bacterium]
MTIGSPDELISVARGLLPADLVFADARVVNVFTAEIERCDVAVCKGLIAGVGNYAKAKRVVDMAGRFLAPAFINGHTHLESSMLDVGQYARAVVPRGTLAVVTDLHEIANVCGMAGIRQVLAEGRGLPLELFLAAPSCVPASPLDTSGAALSPAEIRQILRWKGVIGLGEMMDIRGVLDADHDVMTKIHSTGRRIVDGHAPAIRGKELNAYIAAGIHSDHESVTMAEAREKLRRGMWVMIREGSSEKNLEALLPLVTARTYKRCMFVVDDRSCIDLHKNGDIDAVVRKAVRLGLDPLRAIQLATINPAEYFRLPRLGAVAPGYLANLLVLSDLPRLKIDMVFHRGRQVAAQGKELFALPSNPITPLLDTIHVKPFTLEALRLRAESATMPVIEVVPGQIITRKRLEKVPIVDGEVLPDTARDILKLVVVERHKGSGNIGVGLVRGFGLKRGALASSIAHDSHNIVAVGAGDRDIFAAVAEVERLQGGLVIAVNGKVAAALPLPIAGLMSDRPLFEVANKLEELVMLARDLGTELPSPFATLSFLSLPVIPELRLTARGLVDVKENRLL